MITKAVRHRAIPVFIACLLVLVSLVGNSQTASALSALDTLYSVGGASGDGYTGFVSAVGSGDQLNSGRGIARQSDNKVIVVGAYDKGGIDTDGVVLRYLNDGTPDSSFNNNTGKFVYGGPGIDRFNAVAIDTSDRIVLVGTFFTGSTAGNDVWVMRLNADGTPDTSFGPAGKGEFVIPNVGDDSGNAVVIQPDGKIVIAGTVSTGAGKSSAWIIRLNDTDGTLDPDFNATGTPGSIAINGLTDPDGIHTANAVALDLNGNIVVGGTKSLGGGSSAMWVLRLSPAGVPDNLFGNGGEVALGMNGAHVGNAVAVDANNMIVVVGTYDWSNHSTNSAQGNDIWVQRIDVDGNVDPTFFINGGSGGSSFGGTGNDSGNAVVIQPDGMIVVVGTYDNGADSTSTWIARLKENGQPSTTFNNGSAEFLSTSPGEFTGNAVALQPDKKILVAGTGFIDNGDTSTVMSLRLYGSNNLLQVKVVGGGNVSASPGTLLFNGGLGSYVENYYPGTVVTLQAVPSAGYLFSGWSDPACPGTGDCSVTMTTSKTVTATFAHARLTVTTSGLGVGTVRSTPAGIVCANGSGSGCTSLFPAGSPVALNVEGIPWYSQFTGWSGACSGSGACSVPMSALLNTVNANFDLIYRVKLLRPNDSSDMFYPVLNSDYQSALTHNEQAATIMVKTFTFQETVNYNSSLTMTFNGGTDSNFNNPGTGYTTVQGYLKIKNGRLNVSYLKIK
jgi:uncharacterized delta-60 repeat protein